MSKLKKGLSLLPLSTDKATEAQRTSKTSPITPQSTGRARTPGAQGEGEGSPIYPEPGSAIPQAHPTNMAPAFVKLAV